MSSSTLAELSPICAGYSAVGTIFMFWVAVMITKQPFFIGGLEDIEVCKNSAWGAMVTFIITFILSIGYMIHDSHFKRDEYDAVEIHDRDNILPRGMSNYEVSSRDIQMSETRTIA